MRKTALLAALLVPALLAAAAPARAANPALVAKIETYLRDDEKAFLAAVLTNPQLSAEFDAEAPLALKDPKNLTPFLGAWRGKIIRYAEIDSKLGYPNMDGNYSSFSQLMTPQQKAYMMRRLPTMAEDDRDSLIDYLKKVNDDLQKNGKLTCTLGFCYTKKIVSGIMDHYKTDLSAYLETPMAQAAKRDATAASAAFAAIQRADEEARAPKPVQPPPPAVADVPPAKDKPVKPVPPKPKPVVKPAPVIPPAVPPSETDAGSVAVVPPAGGALDQARNAANSGAPVFDGNAPAPKGPVGGGADVVVPSGPVSARPGLSPAGPVGDSGLAGSIPAVPSPGTGDDMDALLKMRGDKPAASSWIQRAPAIAGGLLGGLLGAVIGFFVGGPIGALIGGAIGAGAGAGGDLLGKKLLS